VKSKIDYLVSPEGQAILKKWGFIPLFPTSTTIPPAASHVFRFVGAFK